jgi:hypothetical protein
MAAKGTQWKGGHPTSPKEQEHRPELVLQAMRLAGTPANKNAGKPAPAQAPATGKRPRKQKQAADAPEGEAAKPKRAKRPAAGSPGADAGGERVGSDKGKRGEQDKDAEPFKPSVTFGDITAAVAGAAERGAQFASGQVQNGAAFVTGG